MLRKQLLNTTHVLVNVAFDFFKGLKTDFNPLYFYRVLLMRVTKSNSRG